MTTALGEAGQEVRTRQKWTRFSQDEEDTQLFQNEAKHDSSTRQSAEDVRWCTKWRDEKTRYTRATKTDTLLFEIELKVSQYYKQRQLCTETDIIDIHVNSKISAVTGVNNILNKGRMQVLNTLRSYKLMQESQL